DPVLVEGPREAGPAGAGFELVERAEQRFAGHHVDVNARLLVVPVGIAERRLGAALLGDVELLGREPAAKVFGRRLAITGAHGGVLSSALDLASGSSMPQSMGRSARRRMAMEPFVRPSRAFVQTRSRTR